jgi:Ni,Fe-hydrogenase I large subunit
MDKFPFSKDEWGEIEDISYEMVNSVYMYDKVSTEIFSKFLAIIKKLETKYGRHPVLVETLADFTDDPKERKKLYTEALEIATKHGLPTISIRNTFATLLIEEFQDHSMANQILEPTDREIEQHDDELDIAEYYRLKRKLTIKLCN